MATTIEIVKYLRPQGGWVVYGDDLAATIYDEGVKPITQVEFDKAAILVEAKLKEEEMAKIQAKQDLLNRLGITEDEAKLLLA